MRIECLVDDFVVNIKLMVLELEYFILTADSA